MSRWLLTAWSLLALSTARADEAWLARAFLPSSNNVHGEVRLLKRGDTACMQTLLYSKYLRRGLHEMAKQERLAWPDGWPCCEFSSNYLAAVDSGKRAVLGQAEPDTNAAPEINRMLIEFSFSPTGTWYTVGDLELDGPPEARRVTTTRVIRAEAAHPHYVSRAMWLMGERGFRLEPGALQELLENAGWRDVAPPEVAPAQRFVPR
jgi:hypothetical protein